MRRHKNPETRTLAEIKCSDKRAFESERIAMKRAEDRKGDENCPPLTAYRCNVCKKWHHSRQFAQGAPKRRLVLRMPT